MSRASPQSGLELVANISPSSDETPTLGRSRSLLEELFGNIGAVGQRGRERPDRGQSGLEAANYVI